MKIHVAVLQWIETVAPELIVFHPASGEFRDAITAGKLKRMGVRRGIPDLVILPPDGRAAFLEIKSPTGRLSPEQQDFGAWCAAHGYRWGVARGIDDARRVFDDWNIATRETMQ
jgi:hypothetical protein